MKKSKVAICEKCNSYVLAAHIDYLTKESERSFSELSNDGFIIKLETLKETKKRNLSTYSLCINGDCSGAIISVCGKYRYKLWRIWDKSKPIALWIMHNPSTADERENDPTIRRIISFTKSWGYGGIYVGNIFPFRATNPRDLKQISITDLEKYTDNLIHIKEMYEKCKIHIVAYGNPIIESQLVKNIGNEFSYLKLTKQGNPSHPLYLKSDLTPILK